MANRLIHGGFIDAYVYAIIVEGIIRYIGKGRRYRAIEHIRKAKEINRLKLQGRKTTAQYVQIKLAAALRSGSAASYSIIANGLTDEAALDLEVQEIAKISGGQLWNKTPGGDGHDGAFVRALWNNPEIRAKIMATRNAKMYTNPEFIERQRANATEQWSDPEKKRRHREQHRALWDDPVASAERKALLKKVWSDPEKSERKRRLVKSQWTPERRKAMAENRRNAWADPEFKRRATESIKRSKAKKQDDKAKGHLPLYTEQPEKV